MNAAAALDPQIFEAGLDGGLTAHGGAADNRRMLAKLGGQFDAGILQSLAGGDQGKLREAVDVSILAAGKIFQGIVAAHFGAVLESKGGEGGGLGRAKGGAASAERGPVIRYIQAERGNHSQARDGDAARGHASGGRRRGIERRRGRGGGEDLLHAFDNIVEGFEGADVVVGDGNLEGVFELEKQGKDVERIDTEVLQAGVQLDGIGRDALHGRGCGDHLLCDFISHLAYPPSSVVRPREQSARITVRANCFLRGLKQAYTTRRETSNSSRSERGGARRFFAAGQGVGGDGCSSSFLAAAGGNFSMLLRKVTSCQIWVSFSVLFQAGIPVQRRPC